MKQIGFGIAGLLVAFSIAPMAPVSAESAGGLEIQAAWARASLAPRGAGAAYLTIMNRGRAADRLIGARTAISKSAQLHTHIIKDDVARMRRVAAIDVAAGTMTVLKPGGHHVMLRSLEARLEAGRSFPLTLIFEKAGEVVVQVKVLGAAAKAPVHADQPAPAHQ